MGYINLPVVTDSDVLVQQALANIAAAVPGWVPREGNLEVLILEQMALMAAEAATVASNVPDEIFAYFGGLVGINPLPGTLETIQVTWSLVNPASGSPGYQIPAGTVVGFYFAGASYQFQTMADAVIATGQTSISLVLQAVTAGSAYDLDTLAASSSLNLSNLYLQLINPDPLVSTILVTATPSTLSTLVLGTDAETTTAYLNRLNAQLQLLAPRPITPSDYATFAQNVAGIYRALAFDGINPFANWLNAASANLTLATSLPYGWTGVGNATTVDTLTTPGTAPSNYVAATTTAAALGNALPVYAATVAGATSITAVVGATTWFGTSVSSSNPILISIADATNGNEVALVYAAAAIASSNQVLTLAAPLQYAHGTSATITILQGAMLPLSGAAPGAVGMIAPNSKYYLASTVVQCGTDTTATAVPYLVAQCTYLDGSTRTFSSAQKVGSTLYDYTAQTKVLECIIPVSNSNSAALAPSSTGPYAVLKPTLASVQLFVVWATQGTTKTHFIYYNSLSAVWYRFDGDDNPFISTSFWNFIFDSNLASLFFGNAALASWTIPSPVLAIPGLGLQYLGTGTALGSALTCISPVFNLSNVQTDLTGTSRTYTAFATIDSSYTGATYGDITLEVWDMGTGAILVAPSTVSISPSSAGVTSLVLPFTLTSPKDVEVRVIFGTGLNVPVNSSVLVTNMGVMSGNQNAAYVVANNDIGATWSPGGLYSTQLFNYPRQVSICPIDLNGLGASDGVQDSLFSYLSAHREINFTINLIQPSYVPIDIQWTGYIQPGYVPSVVQANVNSAIRAFLNPASWALGTSSPPSWDGSQVTIRVFDIASVIGLVQGMGSITSVTTRQSYPTSGAYGISDIVMTGVATLPLANNITGNLLENAASAYSGLS